MSCTGLLVDYQHHYGIVHQRLAAYRQHFGIMYRADHQSSTKSVSWTRTVPITDPLPARELFGNVREIPVLYR